MHFKLFEINEQFMTGDFLIEINQFEKTGSIGKNYISLRKLMIKFHFRN